MSLVLESRIVLACEYDEDDDTMYAWVGDSPQPAITYESNEGHLIRLHPETKELVGVTIFDFKARWEGKEITLEWETEVERREPWIPWIARKRHEKAGGHYVLHRTQVPAC